MIYFLISFFFKNLEKYRSEIKMLFFEVVDLIESHIFCARTFSRKLIFFMKNDKNECSDFWTP